LQTQCPAPSPQRRSRNRSFPCLADDMPAAPRRIARLFRLRTQCPPPSPQRRFRNRSILSLADDVPAAMPAPSL
jgi:hypothetical protein